MKRCQLCERDHASGTPETLGEAHWECAHCGLVQPSEAVDHKVADDGAQVVPFQQREHLQKQADLTFGRLEVMLPKDIARPRLLQVGCQLGHVLHAAKQRGWQAVGVDQRRKAVEFCRARQLDVFHAGPGKLPFESDSFHLVYATDVIDRVGDAARVLKEWKRVLRPGGVLFVATPHVVSKPGSSRVGMASSKGLNYGFSSETLTRFVKRTGLEAVEPPPLGDLTSTGVVAAIQGTVERANRWFKRVSGKEGGLEVFARKPQSQQAPTSWTVRKASKVA